MNDRNRESEEENFASLLSFLEISRSDEEMENFFKYFANLSVHSGMHNNMTVPNFNQNNIYNKLTKVIKENQNELKNLILEDSDLIIKLFRNVKEIGENLNKNKRGIDAMTNQTLM